MTSKGLHPPADLLLGWFANPPNHERRGWGLVVNVCVLFFITLIVVGMRLWARIKLLGNPGIDDILIIPATIFCGGVAFCLGASSRIGGYDRHVWDQTFDLAVKSRKWVFAMEILFVISTAFTKISILFFYRRLASKTISTWFYYIVIGSMAFIVSFSLAYILTLIFGCKPVEAFWTQVNAENLIAQKNYKCVNEPAAMIAAGTMIVAQDFLSFALPLILFWKLQMRRSQKYALMAVFALGFGVCIAGCVRLVYLTLGYYNTWDLSWFTYDTFIWVSVESHVAIICASAPALRAFSRAYVNVPRLSFLEYFRKSRNSRPTLPSFVKKLTQSGIFRRHKVPRITTMQFDSGEFDIDFGRIGNQSRMDGDLERGEHHQDGDSISIAFDMNAEMDRMSEKDQISGSTTKSKEKKADQPQDA